MKQHGVQSSRRALLLGSAAIALLTQVEKAKAVAVRLGFYDPAVAPYGPAELGITVADLVFEDTFASSEYSTPTKLGFYSGYDTTIATDLTTMTATLGGIAPTLCNLYVDQSQNLTGQLNSAQAIAAHVVASGTNLVPTVSVGMALTARSLLLQASDGTYQLLVWNNVPNWTFGTATPAVSGAPVAVTPVSVTATFGTPGTIAVYDPTIGTTAQQSLNGASSVVVSMADYPVVITFKPSLN